MIRIILLILLLSGICLMSALTLEEAKQLALNNNTRYLAQKNSYEAARWSKQQALGGLLPSLTASGTYVYQDPALTGANGTVYNHDSRSAALTLSQPIFMGGKLWQAYRISSVSAEMSRLSLENTRLGILAETESKYLNVLQLQELLVIAEKDLISSQQNLAITEVRFDNGTLSQADYLKVQSKAASKEVTLIQSQTALELAKQDLMNHLGMIEPFELMPFNQTDSDSTLAALAQYNTEQTSAFTRRAEQLSNQDNLSLKTAAASVTLSQKAYNIAKGNFLPTLVLSASRSYRENGTDRYEFDASNTLALTASVPLLPMWTNYSGAKKAYHDVQKSEYDYKTAADGINLAVKSSALTLISSARQVKAAEIALQYTEQTYQQMMERFRNNMLSTTEILDVEVMLQASRVSYTNALYAYLKARSVLLQNLGTDNLNILNTLME